MRRCAGKKGGGKTVSLSCLHAGQSGIIVSIRPVRGADSFKFRALGLIPGAPFLLERTFPIPVLRLPYSSLFLDDELAAGILVYPTESQKSLKKGIRQKEKYGRSPFYSRLKEFFCQK